MNTHIYRDVKSLQLLSGPLASEYKAINSYSEFCKFCKLTIVYALYLFFTKQKGCQGIQLILEYMFHMLWTNCPFDNHAHNLPTLVM